MKLLLMQAVANGYEVLYFDTEQNQWFEFNDTITDNDIITNKYTFYLKSPLKHNPIRVLNCF